MALLTIPGLVGPLTGPPIGGFITTYFSWHWIFLINVPIGIIGIWLSTIFLPEIETHQSPADGWQGVRALRHRRFGRGIRCVGGQSSGSATRHRHRLDDHRFHLRIFFTCATPRANLRPHSPDFRIFQNAMFRAASVGGTIFRISTGAIPFLMPLMLQIGFGLNPFQSGMITLPVRLARSPQNSWPSGCLRNRVQVNADRGRHRRRLHDTRQQLLHA